MPEVRNIICTSCPLGCRLSVKLDGGAVIRVEGNSCARGVPYAEKECLHPERTVSTTVRVTGGGMLPVKTREYISKDRIFDCMDALKDVVVTPPVDVGQVVLKDVFGTDIVATRSIK